MSKGLGMGFLQVFLRVKVQLVFRMNHQDQESYKVKKQKFSLCIDWPPDVAPCQ